MFEIVDTNNDGFIDMNDFKSYFNPSRHPDVIQGKRSAEAVNYEFYDCFETHHRLCGRRDAKVSLSEFMSFY